MRRFLLAVVCAALAVAGCGTVHTGGKPPHASTTDSNHTAARADAQRLLGLLVLPGGAVRSSDEPPSFLRHPGEGPAVTPNIVDLHRWWRVKGSPARAYAFIESHPPRGSKRAGFGSSSQRAVIQTRFLTFSWPPMNGVLGQRWLVVEVVGLADGYAGVRADAQVIWLKSRPASERVPGDARVLTVTRGYPKHKPSLSFTTTNATKIQELSALLNGLQIVQPGAVNCPAMLVAPTVTFTFRAARNGPPLTQASMPTTGPDGQCPGIALKVRGRARPPLYALPVFLRTAGRMLGVTLLTK